MYSSLGHTWYIKSKDTVIPSKQSEQSMAQTNDFNEWKINALQVEQLP